nr:6963_t:CDS:1 [Entrophospora candida]CAG8626915.1 9573_t:CDS:1 [Entrophospora candida]
MECIEDDDCEFYDDDVICLEGECAFKCSGDKDCFPEGKCIYEICNWNDKKTPNSVSLDSWLEIEADPIATTITAPATATSITSAGITTSVSSINSSNNTTTNSTSDSGGNANNSLALNAPFAKTILGITISVLLIGVIFIIICIYKRRRKESMHRGLRPLKLSHTRTSSSSSLDGSHRRSGSKSNIIGETTTVTSL